MMERMISQLAHIGVRTARSYFGAEIELAEFESLFSPLLGPPRNMWLAERQGIVTRNELILFVADRLHGFLVNHSGRRPNPDPLMENLPELYAQIAAALTLGE